MASGIEKAAEAFQTDLEGPRIAEVPKEQVKEPKPTERMFENLEAPPKKPQEDEGEPDADEPLEEDGADESAEPVEEEEGEEEEDKESESAEDRTPLNLEQVVQVTVDGKPQEVTLKEALEGYIRTDTFHQRLNALNTEKQTIEKDKGELTKARGVYGQLLQALTEQLDAVVPKEPDWDKLYAEDPTQAAVQERQWRKYKDQRQALENEKGRVSKEQQAEMAKQFESYVAQERQKIAANHPQWKDQKVYERDRNSMVRTAKNSGFTDEEINGLVDSRMVSVLMKAAKYDRMMAAKPKAVSTGIKPARPGTGNSMRTVASDRAQRQLAKTGHVHDAVSVFQQILSREK
jgi:hypothetical protein